MDEEADRRWVAAAIRLGAGGLGTTWPNPSVGAILLDGNRVLARARTAHGGRPHAETIALAQAGAGARGTTLHVSLEPCSHHGRTPPCADAIIAAGVSRVVAAVGDVNPAVGGSGFERLRAAGIEVVESAQAAAGRRANSGHATRVSLKRPHVTLKMALSRDEAIGRRGEGQVQVSGEIARRHAQALRSRFDAILVGRGTVEADDPELTCRLPGLEFRSPVRVLLDSAGRLGREHKIFGSGPPTWVLQAAEPDAVGGSVRRLRVPAGAEGRIDLAAAMRRLADEGITRILVEGGAAAARSFLDADLADEVLLFRGATALGGDIVPAFAGLPVSDIEASGRFNAVDRRRFGADRMIRFERAR